MVDFVFGTEILPIYPCSIIYSLLYFSRILCCRKLSKTKSLESRTLTQLRHMTSDNMITFH